MNFPNFGLNAECISFIGIIVFTIVEGWGLWKQNIQIWANKSGASISTPAFIFSTAAFFSLLVYGISKVDPALIFNGLISGLFFLAIVIGLKKFKGFTKPDTIFGLGCLGVFIVSIVTPWKDIFCFFFQIGCAVIFALQPYEIWRRKSRGVVEIRLLVAYLVSNLFWTVYAFAIIDWVLMIVCPTFALINAITVALWIKYR